MRALTILLLTVIGASCSAPESTELTTLQTAPCELWRDDDMHCTLSIYSLIAFPMKYDGIIVSVKGYVSEGQYTVLFSDRESAEYSILENGVRLNGVKAQPQLERAARIGRYVRLTGKFMAAREDEHALDKGSLFFTAGTLDVRTVIAENEDSWGCLSIESIDEQLIKERFIRADACRNLEIRKDLERRRESDKPAPAV